MNNFEEQCKELYKTAFKDDGEFLQKLFSTFYKSSCRYVEYNGIVVSMAFFIDVFAGNKKGKYIYAVATLPEYRNKGFMSKIFESAEIEFKREYDFFCLHPANESLKEMYAKKGFSADIYGPSVKCAEIPPTEIKSSNELSDIRKKLAPKNSIEYSKEYLELLLLYSKAFCDSIKEPKELLIIQNSGEYVEYLSENTKNSGAAYSMSKPLKKSDIVGYYFGITLE